MNQRRSLCDALTLTPEKRAFIEGAAGTLPDTASPDANPAPNRVVTNNTLSADATPIPARQGPLPQSPTRFPALEPAPATTQVLVPITTRLMPRTADALRRAYLEQKLRHAAPATQQEIVEQALHDWLKREGYLA